MCINQSCVVWQNVLRWACFFTHHYFHIIKQKQHPWQPIQSPPCNNNAVLCDRALFFCVVAAVRISFVVVADGRIRCAHCFAYTRKQKQQQPHTQKPVGRKGKNNNSNSGIYNTTSNNNNRQIVQR